MNTSTSHSSMASQASATRGATARATFSGPHARSTAAATRTPGYSMRSTFHAASTRPHVTTLADGTPVKFNATLQKTLHRPDLSTFRPSALTPAGKPTAKSVTSFLDPMKNYLPTGTPKNKTTYCNYFTQDFMKLKGVSNFPALNANDTNRYLNSKAGAAAGWKQVSGQEAQDYVNAGGVGVVSSPKPGGHGHLAPVIEGKTVNGEPTIANAGSANFAEGPATASLAFTRANTQYFIHP